MELNIIRSQLRLKIWVLFVCLVFTSYKYSKILGDPASQSRETWEILGRDEILWVMIYKKFKEVQTTNMIVIVSLYNTFIGGKYTVEPNNLQSC